MLYAETEDERANKLEDLYADNSVNKYPQYQKHLIRDTFPKMQAWSIARRVSDKLPTSNQNTNNLVESSFRYTKDIQFNRIKAFNIPDMLSLVMDKSEFYINKAIDAANNRIAGWLRNCHSRYVIKKPKINPDKIVKISEDVYLVPSESDPNVSYVVDMVLRCCACPQGRLHGPCKHKKIVSESFNVPSFDIIPTQCPKMRQVFMFLATGTMKDLDWFLPVQADPVTEPCNPRTEPDTPGIESHDPSIETPIIEPMDISIEDSVDREMVVDSTTAGIDSDRVKEKLRKVISKLENKILSRIDHDPSGYDKALDNLNKTIEKLPSTVDSALQKTLHAFGKTVTQV